MNPDKLSEQRSSWRRKLLEFGRSLVIALPPGLLAGWLLVRNGNLWKEMHFLVLAAVGSVVVGWWWQATLLRRLGTMASVLTSFREGDFSIRAQATKGNALLDETIEELNQLGDTLREHRLGELEAWSLLRKVMAEVDVVVLAFDNDGRLKLANDAAAKALGVSSATSLFGTYANQLGVEELVQGTVPRIVRDSAVLGTGPWELRRGSFRLSGKPHDLVVLSDVSGALREQEREAWKRLIRVMGHEINNSLAPIQSISESLRTLLNQDPLPEGWQQDAEGGLSVVARRSEALGRFMSAYAKLARLPPPTMAVFQVASWVERVVALELRVPIHMLGGPEIELVGDADQLEQMLINLLKNAAEASLEHEGAVYVSWTVTNRQLQLVVADDGPGVGQTTNLFVPFFTTKQGGSGIGLVLARQIAEAHGGLVELRNRSSAQGAEATVRLPLR
jgi:two-component system, NtrC family, nitrogen regulation sensor histidine kinase NtrY